MAQKQNREITTIKLNKKTKQRLDRLRVHKRDSYDEIVQRMLSILNTCRVNPVRAQSKLIFLEKQVRRSQRKFPAEA